MNNLDFAARISEMAVTRNQEAELLDAAYDALVRAAENPDPARMRDALERARHALTTCQGLHAFDGAAPGEVRTLNDSALLALIDDVLGAPTGRVMEPLG